MELNTRQYPRAPMTGTVQVYEWNRPMAANAVEISGGGMFLRTDAAMSEGSMLTLRLNLPGGTSAFTVLGKVVRTVRGSLLKPPGVGIQFIDISAADRRTVLEYVARRRLRAA